MKLANESSLVKLTRPFASVDDVVLVLPSKTDAPANLVEGAEQSTTSIVTVQAMAYLDVADSDLTARTTLP